MCGILGVVAKRPIEVARCRAALDSLAHRGPDGEGEWHDADAGIWLGHRRLSIIDLSHAGDQPMLSPDGRFALIFNGEIYNYVELKRELIGLGASFVSESDSEVIIEGYRVWGRDVLTRLERHVRARAGRSSGGHDALRARPVRRKAIPVHQG